MGQISIRVARWEKWEEREKASIKEIKSTQVHGMAGVRYHEVEWVDEDLGRCQQEGCCIR